MFNINFCLWLDSNYGPLESEATALPTEPQPLPIVWYLGHNLVHISACEVTSLPIAKRLPSADQLTHETLSDPGTGKSWRWTDPSSPTSHKIAFRSVAALTNKSLWFNRTRINGVILNHWNLWFRAALRQKHWYLHGLLIQRLLPKLHAEAMDAVGWG